VLNEQDKIILVSNVAGAGKGITDEVVNSLEMAIADEPGVDVNSVSSPHTTSIATEEV
jgi:hypothetical protein